MRRIKMAATLVAVAGSVAATAQDVAAVPVDTPEEIAKDAARDLKDSRFYNRPGATRAQYDADWQDCRMIARGSRTPSGAVPTYYNTGVASPLAAGVGGAIGGAIGAAIVEGQMRRANRRACLMIRGWRLVEVPAAQATAVAAMTDAQRSQYFDGIVGATDVPGEITERTSFTQATAALPDFDGPIGTAGIVFMGKKVDPASPLTLAPGEGAVVFAFRRPSAASAGRSGQIDFARYDMAQRDLVYRPRDWKKRGDVTTYLESALSQDRLAGYEVHVRRLTAGDYVMSGRSVGRTPVVTNYCFGAPTFHVAAGEIVYVGDFVPTMHAKLNDLVHTSHIEDARRILAARQPDLANRMTAATIRDRATFACSATMMDRWDLPDAEDLAPLAVTPAAPTQPVATTPPTTNR